MNSTLLGFKEVERILFWRNNVKAVEEPSGLASKFAGFKTPFATAIYLWPAASITWKFFNVSLIDELFPGATPILIKVPDGNGVKGVAFLKAKSSNVKLPLT